VVSSVSWCGRHSKRGLSRCNVHRCRHFLVSASSDLVRSRRSLADSKSLRLSGALNCDNLELESVPLTPRSSWLETVQMSSYLLVIVGCVVIRMGLPLCLVDFISVVLVVLASSMSP
jgi:hypothetical protein